MSSTHVPELVQSLTNLVDHLTTTAVHPQFPFLRFAVLHAIRVSIVWAGLTRRKSPRTGAGTGTGTGREDKVGVLGDLFGYLVMCWGGSTLVAILQSQPPPWLVSPQMWIVYITTYLLTLPTGLSTLITQLPGINILGSWIDGLTRGFTVCAISSTPHTMMGRALLSAIGTGGGGWMVQLFGMDGPWTLGTPGILKSGQGVLSTMDVWAALLGSIIFSSLTSTSSDSNSNSNSNSGHYLLSTSRTTLESYIPESMIKSLQSLSVASHARSAVIAIMASLFFARIITTSLTSSSLSSSTQTKTKTSIKNSLKSKSSESKSRKVGEEIDNLVQEIEAKAQKAQKAASRIGSKSESESTDSTPRKRKGVSTAATPQKSSGSK